MRFLTEPEPPRGVAEAVAPGVRRVVAPNPGTMTYHGTNTYLIDAPASVFVLDPGPDDSEHVRAVLTAAGAPVAAILLSHTHEDHYGGLAYLRAATGAPVYGWHQPAASYGPDLLLHDGDKVGEWQAVFTPGHAADHLCFAGPNGVVFSGDHVMGWSTTVVGPPGGDMADYFQSLHRLLGREDQLFLPGHGPPILQPQAYVRDLLAHREAREAAVAAALGTSPQSVAKLAARLYSDVAPALRRAAERNVAAHLGKLAKEGRARKTRGGWRT